MKIIDGDNFGGDYPNEKFLSLTDSDGKSFPLYFHTKEEAERICQVLNRHGDLAPRYYSVVKDDYTLAPGFEP